jgi:hypothetical protein
MAFDPLNEDLVEDAPRQRESAWLNRGGMTCLEDFVFYVASRAIAFGH